MRQDVLIDGLGRTNARANSAGRQVWQARIRSRGPFALAVTLATAALYAEGVLKNGWIEAALLLPIGWYLLAPSPSAVLNNLLLSLLVACLALSGGDLLLRPLIGQRFHFTPLNIVSRKLPRLPIVGRWDPNVFFDAESYGDLAAMAGDPSLREPRRIVFQTDAAGFRNSRITEPIDLVVLGDSFGAGAGTSQDRIFATVLNARYGRHVYNLSYPGGPYDQYINFAIEWPRLNVVSKTVMIWTLYIGNDLDDAGGETWAIDALPWRNEFAAWQVMYRTFRNRSPLNQFMEGLRARWRGSLGDVIVRTLPDGRPMLFLNRHEAWGMRPKEEIEHDRNFQRLERTFAVMRALADARSVDVTILILPTKGDIYRWVFDQRAPKPEDARPSGFAEAVLSACSRTGFRCLDTKPYLTMEARRLWDSSGQLLWWRDDTHLGELGHEAMAEFISHHVFHRQPGSVVTHD